MDVLHLLQWIPSSPLRLSRPRSHVPVASAGKKSAMPLDGALKGGWVLKILRVGSLFAESEKKREAIDGALEGDEMEMDVDGDDRCVDCGCACGDEETTAEFDRESFSRLLRRASLMETRLYAKMSYLGSLAYSIPRIKSEDLLKRHGLRFVTSSLDKKEAKSLAAEKEGTLIQDSEPKEKTTATKECVHEHRKDREISASAAYHIAASAAAYLQSQTRGFLHLRSSNVSVGKDSPELGIIVNGSKDEENMTAKMASFIATKDSVTAMVAGKEEMKQAVAKDLSSSNSSPCEWYICDDDQSCTRYFVIQECEGSETLGSWQANLLFEPIEFEGMDVLVHRGIYEAAKGIYSQVLPEVRQHLESHGDSATFRFTGHSLGGSLSMLINLMLLIRGEAPVSSLLPVVTLGAPSIMCGGDYLLRKLGLPQTHVQSVMLHRDIVPRAFSCIYPDHVVDILKAISGNFRHHPCLKKKKLLYAPMGKLLILQPEDKFSPHHHLLPAGSGLFLLDSSSSADSADALPLLQSAWFAFLNTPHPLEILIDRNAYGSSGSVIRDHDVHGYLTSLRGVIHQELKFIRETNRKQLHRSGLSSKSFRIYSIFHGGKQTLKRLRKTIKSQSLQMLVIFLVPIGLLFSGALVVAILV
ncbi:putative fungal lipase-like domain, alpha/Beta hydrolase, phospholipase A1 PLIP1/2/3 [Dioscorea sansibarensis]